MDQTITFRLSSEERKLLTAEAEKLNLSLSEFIRKKVICHPDSIGVEIKQIHKLVKINNIYLSSFQEMLKEYVKIKLQFSEERLSEFKKKLGENA